MEASLDSVVDPLTRGLIWSALWNATRDGELSTARYLSMAQRFSPAESNLALLTGVPANASYAIEHYLPDADRPAWRRQWLDSTWEALFGAEPGSGAQLAWVRAVAAAATVKPTRADDIRAMVDGSGTPPEGLRLDPDVRWALWTALAATGHAERGDLDDELRSDDTGSGRTAYLRAVAARPDAAVKAQAWSAIFTDMTLSNDHLGATITGFRAGGRRDLVARYDGEYFAAIRAVWAERSIEIAKRIVVGLFPGSESSEPVDAWLEANADAPAALRRLVIEQRDHLKRDLRVQRINAG